MSLFGEIREQVTRALVDDDNHEDGTLNQPRLNWSSPVTIPKKIATLLVIEGFAAVEFAEISLVDSKPSNSIPECGVCLYEIQNNITICTWNKPDLLQSADVTELLRPWIEKADEVVSIQSLPLPTYQSRDRTEEEFVIRTLKTKYYGKPAIFPNLEQPNIVTGATAGAITLCNFIDKPAIMYVYYLSSSVSGLDSITASHFTNLFNKLKINLSKPFVPRKKVPSNMYL